MKGRKWGRLSCADYGNSHADEHEGKSGLMETNQLKVVSGK